MVLVMLNIPFANVYFFEQRESDGFLLPVSN